MRSPLTLLAGPRALATIQREGLTPERVEHVIGGAGGPKALGLVGLDATLFGQWLTPGPAPRWLLGSSIATWRFLCALHPDPATMFPSFAQHYLDMTFSAKARRGEIDATTQRMLLALLQACGGAEPVLSHPHYRLALVCARSRGLLGSENAWMLAPLLGSAFLLNWMTPRFGRAFFERAVLHDARGTPPLLPGVQGQVALTPLAADTLVHALTASTAIPFVMSGVPAPQGWPAGTYRDGGLIDYHQHHLATASGGIILFPHFTEHLTASWFDKPLPARRRQARLRAVDDVLVVAPSAQYLSQLPGGKVPDRGDYKRMTDQARVRCWQAAVDESQRLGDAFAELAATGRLEGAVRPLPVASR